MITKSFQYDEKYSITALVETHSVVFTVHEAINYDPSDLEIIMEFWVRFDGCANVMYNINEVDTHFCKPEHLTEFYDLQMFMYETALEHFNK